MTAAIMPDSLLNAPIWRRIFAAIYDFFPLLGIWMGIGLIAVAIKGDAISPNTIWFNLLLFVISAGYFIVSWMRGGQTLGMRAWNLTLVSNNEKKLTWLRAALRFILMLLALPVFALGILLALFDTNRRMLHDRFSKTSVIEIRPRAE
jgi:uncharacterized RDD family membrane protein YckC